VRFVYGPRCDRRREYMRRKCITRSHYPGVEPQFSVSRLATEEWRARMISFNWQSVHSIASGSPLELPFFNIAAGNLELLFKPNSTIEAWTRSRYSWLFNYPSTSLTYFSRYLIGYFDGLLRNKLYDLRVFECPTLLKSSRAAEFGDICYASLESLEIFLTRSPQSRLALSVIGAMRLCLSTISADCGFPFFLHLTVVTSSTVMAWFEGNEPTLRSTPRRRALGFRHDRMRGGGNMTGLVENSFSLGLQLGQSRTSAIT